MKRLNRRRSLLLLNPWLEVFLRSLISTYHIAEIWNLMRNLTTTTSKDYSKIWCTRAVTITTTNMTGWSRKQEVKSQQIILRVRSRKLWSKPKRDKEQEMLWIIPLIKLKSLRNAKRVGCWWVSKWLLEVITLILLPISKIKLTERIRISNSKINMETPLANPQIRLTSITLQTPQRTWNKALKT